MPTREAELRSDEPPLGPASRRLRCLRERKPGRRYRLAAQLLQQGDHHKVLRGIIRQYEARA
jgi:hypothetical protein